MNTTLSWKNIIITWWTNGLWKSIALQLKGLWANVIIIWRNKDKIALLEKEWIHGYSCDLKNTKALEEVFSTILSTHWVDILINNAGIREKSATEDCSSERLSDVFAVNTEWTIRSTQQVIPYMKEQKSWQILNVSSIAWIDKCPDRAIYWASKAAITQFTESTQQELQPFGIKVMWIYPWWMNTDLFSTAWTVQWEQERMMDKEDVAKIVITMLSQPSDVIVSHVEVRKFLVS